MMHRFNLENGSLCCSAWCQNVLQLPKSFFFSKIHSSTKMSDIIYTSGFLYFFLTKLILKKCSILKDNKKINKIDISVKHKKKNYMKHLYFLQEGCYLPSNRNSPKSEWIENAPLAILISTKQFKLHACFGVIRRECALFRGLPLWLSCFSCIKSIFTNKFIWMFLMLDH